MIGHCAKCNHQSDNWSEFHTMKLCKICYKNYFKVYMSNYNKIEGNYKYKNKWMQIMSNLQIGLVL